MRPRLFLFVLLAAGATALTARAQTLEIIAVTGDTVPGTNDTITQVGDEPVLNESGQVALDVSLDLDGGGTANAILRGEASSPLVEIARSGGPPPDSIGMLFFFDQHGLADNGTVVFDAFVQISGVPGLDNLFLRGDGTNPLVQIARKGGTGPGGEPIDGFDSPPPRINVLGQTVFGATLDLENGGSTADDDVIFSWTGAGPLVEVVREGELAPNGSAFRLLGEVVQNNASQIAFAGDLIGGTEGIFRVDGGSTIVQIALEGQNAPDGNGTFRGLDGPLLNESGVVGFQADLDGATGGADEGIFRSNGVDPVEQIVRTGTVIPGGNGNLFSIEPPAFNGAGQAAFRGFVDLGDGGNGFDERAVFLADGVNPLTLIARANTPVPVCTIPGLEYSVVERPAINDLGQVAFDAGVKNVSTGVTGGGVYFFDPTQGLIEVVSLGTPLLGSTVRSVEFSEGDNGSGEYYANDRNGINNQGQVAFQFILEDGRSGVALWTIGPAVNFQTDNLIGRSANPAAGAGDDVYNTNGIQQTLNLVSRRGRAVRGTLNIQNDGAAADQMHLRGTRGNRIFKVVYLSGGNVTGAVTTGAFMTPSLNPDENHVVSISIKPSKKKVLKKIKRGGRTKKKWLKKKITLILRSVSCGNHTREDTARVEVKHK